MATYKHLRSGTANKRPTTSIADGQLAINTNTASPGLFFKDSAGTGIVKVGPVHVGTTAPNSVPAPGGSTGNYLGEQWLDTGVSPAQMKVWNGSTWVGVVADELPVSKLQDGTARQLIQTDAAGTGVEWTSSIDLPGTLDVTGATTLDSTLSVAGNVSLSAAATLVFEGATDDAWETTLSVVDPTSDRSILLPNVSGTVVTTGDTGTITSTMIADGTIVNGDINASAAIAGTKISPDFGSQTVATTGIFSHALGTASAPTVTFTGDTNTGIYSPGADQVAISTGGSGRLFVDASGRVGVGVASPSYPFHIANGAIGVTSFSNSIDGAGEVGLLLRGQNGSHNTSLLFSSSNTNFRTRQYFNVADGSLKWDTSSDGTTFSERLRITAAGLVGVGTSSPDNLLSVRSTSEVINYTAADFRSNAAGTGLSNTYIKLEKGSGFGGAIGGFIEQGVGSGLKLSTLNSGTISDVVVIRDTGRVGIGTTSPVARLTVVEDTGTGPINLGDFRASSASQNPLVRIISRNAANTGTTSVDLYKVYQSGFQIINNDTDASNFTSFNVGSSERARIDSSGRLLVGTSSSSSTAAGFTPAIQAVGTNATASAAVSITRYGNDSTEGVLSIAKSRGTLGVQTVVTSDDSVGRIDFEGSNGSTFLRAASIQAAIDGTVSGGGVGDMPGRIVLSTTADGASSPTPRMTIKSNGNVGIGTASPASTLHVVGTAQINTGNSADGLLIRREFNNPIDLRLRTFDDSAKDYIIRNDNGTLRFIRNATEVAQLDTSGRLLVGTSSAFTGLYGGNNALYINSPNGQCISYFAASAVGARLDFLRSRNATTGSHTVMQSGDDLGGVYWGGSDGSAFIPAGFVRCEVDGTPGANAMPGRLVFSTTSTTPGASPTPRMTISNAGAADFYGNANVIGARSASTAGTTDRLFFGAHSAVSTSTGTVTYTVWTNGNVVNTNNSYGSLSDIKLKENIVDATSQWSDIKALQVRKYNFKEGQTHTQIGLIAQEVELVSPGLVSESPDRDEDGNDLGTVTKSVNYSVLYMKAVKALQEAMERIETLEAKVAALESA